MVEELDDSTGRILDKLRVLGLADRTLVLFTSDNGPERNTPGTAVPLRGTKHTVFEGGLRVPCIAWWPSNVPSAMVCNEFTSTLDVFPTLARLIKAQLLRESGKLDGHDVSSVLLGEKDARSPRTTLYSLYGYKQNRHESFREGQWKLHLSTPPELYDLKSNISEAANYDQLGASSEEARLKTVEKYRSWLNAAATLGCSGIRVIVKVTQLILLCIAAILPAQARGEEAELLFVRRIVPLFHEKCLACHGNDEAKISGGLDMRTLATMLKGGESETPGLIAGKPE